MWPVWVLVLFKEAKSSPSWSMMLVVKSQPMLRQKAAAAETLVVAFDKSKHWSKRVRLGSYIELFHCFISFHQPTQHQFRWSIPIDNTFSPVLGLICVRETTPKNIYPFCVLSCRAGLEPAVWCVEHRLHPVRVLPGLHLVPGKAPLPFPIPYCLWRQLPSKITLCVWSIRVVRKDWTKPRMAFAHT